MGEPGRGASVVRYLDLLVLAAALVVFLAAGLPMLGYGVVAGVWLGQLAIEWLADRRAAQALAQGDRRTALGWVAATTLGRVWMLTLAVLLVGLQEREAGLAGAVLAAVLFTVHLTARVIWRLMSTEEAG
ncbi:MAG: hypothetical protein M3M99_07550 [Actinomycetota bacterium]|nr:hypothetical protein [Actinomycetota bacterium]